MIKKEKRGMSWSLILIVQLILICQEIGGREYMVWREGKSSVQF